MTDREYEPDCDPSRPQAPSPHGQAGNDLAASGYQEPVWAWLAEEQTSAGHEVWVADESDEQVVLAELVEEGPHRRFPVFMSRPRVLSPRRRRVRLPLVLFLCTCFSTFLAGACLWVPFAYVEISRQNGSLMPLRAVIVAHWADGLVYMACVLAILLAHEMGHFLTTIHYRVPASLPYFLPLPVLSPIGTLGAVIGMEGHRANRREVFDIGVAGPLAGLAVAVPILWVGVSKLDFTRPEYGMYQLDMPVIARLLLDYLQPNGYAAGQRILNGHLNPYFMAGWVGLLVTGLNMMPVSQLDGGHVIYTLLGRRSRWVARGFVLLAVGYIFVSGMHALWLMVVLIMLVGTDHPPTRDDSVSLGWFRTLLGCCSLAIPVLCFAPRVLLPTP